MNYPVSTEFKGLWRSPSVERTRGNMGNKCFKGNEHEHEHEQVCIPQPVK